MKASAWVIYSSAQTTKHQFHLCQHRYIYVCHYQILDIEFYLYAHHLLKDLLKTADFTSAVMKRMLSWKLFSWSLVLQRTPLLPTTMLIIFQTGRRVVNEVRICDVCLCGEKKAALFNRFIHATDSCHRLCTVIYGFRQYICLGIPQGRSLWISNQSNEQLHIISGRNTQSYLVYLEIW